MVSWNETCYCMPWLPRCHTAYIGPHSPCTHTSATYLAEPRDWVQRLSIECRTFLVCELQEIWQCFAKGVIFKVYARIMGHHHMHYDACPSFLTPLSSSIPPSLPSFPLSLPLSLSLSPSLWPPGTGKVGGRHSNAAVWIFRNFLWHCPETEEVRLSTLLYHHTPFILNTFHTKTLKYCSNTQVCVCST